MNLFSVLGSLREPLGLLCLVNLAATIELIRRRSYRGALYPATLVILLWVVGGMPFVPWLMAPLECPYAAVDVARLPACDAVVSLGGGVRPSRNDPLGLDCTARQIASC